MYQLTLSPQEVEEITGYTRYTEQQRQLRCHGIPFATGQKNEPIVLRRNFQQIIAPLPQIEEFVATEPDFGALDNGKTA